MVVKMIPIYAFFLFVIIVLLQKLFMNIDKMSGRLEVGIGKFLVYNRAYKNTMDMFGGTK